MMCVPVCVLCVATNLCDSTSWSVRVTVLLLHTHGHNSRDVEVYQGHRCHQFRVLHSLTSHAGLAVDLLGAGAFGSVWRLSGSVLSRCFLATLGVLFVMKTLEDEW